jgi:hypothetical protein
MGRVHHEAHDFVLLIESPLKFRPLGLHAFDFSHRFVEGFAISKLLSAKVIQDLKGMALGLVALSTK